MKDRSMVLAASWVYHSFKLPPNHSTTRSPPRKARRRWRTRARCWSASWTSCIMRWVWGEWGLRGISYDEVSVGGVGPAWHLP